MVHPVDSVSAEQYGVDWTTLILRPGRLTWATVNLPELTVSVRVRWRLAV